MHIRLALTVVLGVFIFLPMETIAKPYTELAYRTDRNIRQGGYYHARKAYRPHRTYYRNYRSPNRSYRYHRRYSSPSYYQRVRHNSLRSYGTYYGRNYRPSYHKHYRYSRYYPYHYNRHYGYYTPYRYYYPRQRYYRQYRAIPRSYAGKWGWYKNGYVPRNAVVSGYYQKRPVYICQAKHGKRLYTGQLYRGHGCYIQRNNKNYRKMHYRVLTR